MGSVGNNDFFASSCGMFSRVKKCFVCMSRDYHNPGRKQPWCLLCHSETCTIHNLSNTDSILTGRSTYSFVCVIQIISKRAQRHAIISWKRLPLLCRFLGPFEISPVEAAGIDDQPVVLVQVLGSFGYLPIQSKPVTIEFAPLVLE